MAARACVCDEYFKRTKRLWNYKCGSMKLWCQIMPTHDPGERVCVCVCVQVAFKFM